MKRLLFAASAVALALVMNGAAFADGHGKGGGGGDHGWHGGPVWSNGWKGDWDEGYWRQGYYYNPNLPNPEAEVTIGGQKMNSLGMVRNFELPPVEQGKTDTYKVTATWTDGGNTITDVRRVALTPGSAATVDFTQPAPIERVASPAKTTPESQEVPSQAQNVPPR